METRNKLTHSLLVLMIGAATVLSVACGDDDDSNPAPTAGKSNTGGSSSSGGKSGDTGGKTGDTGGTGDVSNGGGMPPDTNQGGEGGSGGAAPDCTDDQDSGCYRCKPKTHLQFLNACPTTGSEGFDNSNLTSLQDDKLPALP